MPTPKQGNKPTAIAVPQDQKSEFLIELADRYAYWTKKKNMEFAKAYETMLCAFTQPDKK